jgi:4-hydroxy-2-oxoheptanedioate aldolase
MLPGEQKMKIRPNRIKHKLAEGGTAYVISGFTHPDDIDAFGPIGFDGVWLEGEHGAVDAAELGNLTRSCDIWSMTSVVRINRNDQSLIYRTLDRGAQGIVVPHVNTKEEAQNVVLGGKFAPIGQRGMFTSRQGYGVPDYFQIANDETLLVVLIEDIVAIRNLDEILTVDHIDVFFVAPSDLATSMGHIGDSGHPAVQRTIDDALARIQAAGRIAGSLANNKTVAKYAAAGVRFFLTGIQPWIAAGAAEFMNSAESGRLSK